MKKKKLKVCFNGTLSVYHGGMHRIEGFAQPRDLEYGGNLSIAESMSPFHYALQEFHKFPLGTKLKITVENVNK